MSVLHPLAPFIRNWAEPPYHTAEFTDLRFEWDARVVAVTPRLKFGWNKKGPARYAHRVRSMAGVVRAGRMYFAAHWFCRGGASDRLVLQADQGELEICPKCEDRRAGPAVYRIRNAAGRLLYVGATTELCTRLRQHELTKPWWNEAADARIERYADMESALAAEVAAILAEKPKYNERAIGRHVYADFVPTPAFSSAPLRIDLPVWRSA